nr:unnamed protein product [Spirometra erinaceieuropaei]
MSSIATRRVQKELLEFQKGTDAFENPIEIRPISDNIMKLEGTISGPPDTPYEGARYTLEILIPDNYPFAPPKDQWAAAMSLRTMLLSIQALLASPEPDDPQDAVVASQFKSNRAIFNLTARHWASVYANGPSKQKDCEEKVEKLIQLGFSETEARAALSMKNWDIPMAAEHLLK